MPVKLRIDYPELPEQAPWTDDEVRQALDTDHPLKGNMMVEATAQYFDLARQLRREQQQPTRPDSFMRSLLHRLLGAS